MSKVEEVVPKLQFLLTEDQLEDIYESLIYAVGPATLRTQILLSKPEEEFTTKEEVYEDYFILLLDRNQIIPKHCTVDCETGVMLRYPLVTMWFWFSIGFIFKIMLEIKF